MIRYVPQTLHGTCEPNSCPKKLKKVVINTIPVPEIPEDEILVKTVAASLCHSDVVSQGQFL